MMNWINRIIVALILSLCLQSAADASRLPESVRRLPVQYNGRVMPFASFAREHVLSVTGKLKWKGQNPSETIIDWIASSETTLELKLLSVGYEPLRKEIGLDLKRRRFSLDEIIASPRLLELSSQAARVHEEDGKLTKIESESEKVVNRANNLYGLLTQQTPGWFPSEEAAKGTWTTLYQRSEGVDSIKNNIRVLVTGMIGFYIQGDFVKMDQAANELNKAILACWQPSETSLKRFDAEAQYNRYRPTQVGRTLYLVALIVLLASLIGWGNRLVPAAGVLLTMGLLSQVWGLILRSIAGGRAPWSNFYESLITLTAALVLFGLLLAKKKMRGLVFGGIAFAGYFALLIADRAGLSPGVDTLMPALQSYWLTIHVIVIMAGYATAALAMVLGHVALGVESFKPDNRQLFLNLTTAVYRSVQLTVLLVFAGTILGGIWAAEAWGRYWGWDPKETWSLITWFAYLGVAHARFAGWLKPRGMAMAAIGVFPVILMTYYGVNYLLSGLHSYAGGQSASVPPLLIAFLVFEAVVLVIAWKGWHVRRNAKS